MNGRTVTFLATMISSVVGMILFVIIIATASIKGYGEFGRSGIWENSSFDDDLVEKEKELDREKNPELYEDEYEYYEEDEEDYEDD